jgi:hypothetical protein
MKTKIESTKKTTVTLTVKDFLENLNIEASGKLTAVIVTPEAVWHNAFEEDRVEPAKVNLYFEKKQTENVEN